MAIAIATGVGFVVRLLLVLQMPSPFLFYDEMTGVAVAQFLVDGDRTYGVSGKPLLGLLMTPLTIAFRDPEAFYIAALVLNVALVSLLPLLLYRIAVDGFELAPRPAALAAVVGSFAAPTIGYPAILAAESLLIVTTTIVVSAFARLLRFPDQRRSQVLMIGALTLVLLSHSRSLVITIAVILGLTIAALAGQLRTQTALILAVSSAGALALTTVGSSALNSRVFVEESPIAGSPTAIIDAAFANPQLALRSAIGTSFYLGASTAGLAFVGLLHLARHRSVFNCFVGLCALGAGALSAMFVAGVMLNSGFRVDAYTYGRYVDYLTPVVLVAGVAGWQQATTRFAGLALGAAAIVAGGLIARRLYDEFFWLGPNAQSNNIGLHWIKPFENVIDVGRIWPIALVPVLLLAGAGLAPRLRAGAPLAVGGLGILAGFCFIMLWAEELRQPDPLRLAVNREDTLAIPIDTIGPLGAQFTQFWTGNASFVPYFAASGAIPCEADLVMLRLATPSPDGAVEAATDSERELILWRLPTTSCP